MRLVHKKATLIIAQIKVTVGKNGHCNRVEQDSCLKIAIQLVWTNGTSFTKLATLIIAQYKATAEKMAL
jgi:hypothetical protein